MWGGIRICWRKGERKFEGKISIGLDSQSKNEARAWFTESGGPAIVAIHSRRFESVLGKAETPGAFAIISCISSD